MDYGHIRNNTYNQLTDPRLSDCDNTIVHKVGADRSLFFQESAI